MYALILWFMIGAMSEKDSMTAVTLNFGSETLCQQAGQAALKMVEGTKKGKYICVKTGV